MKKKRTIILRNPRLQKSRQWNLLNDIYTKIRFDNFDKDPKVRDLSIEEERQVKELRGQMSAIDRVLDYSICKCTVCSAWDKNMTYNPVTKRWFCVDCYQQLQADYKGTKKSILFP